MSGATAPTTMRGHNIAPRRGPAPHTFTVSKDVVIRRPIEEVFEYLADPCNDPEWCPAVSVTEPVPGDGAQPGPRWRFVHSPGPFKDEEGTIELVDKDPPHRITWLSETEGAFFLVTYRLEPVEDGTRFTQESETHFRGRTRRLWPVMRFLVSRGVASQMRRLRRILDQETAA